MATEKKIDPWADLIGDLGIDTPGQKTPQAGSQESRPESEPAPPVPPPSAPPAASPPPVKGSEKSSWGALAGELGLEVEKPVSAAPPKATPAPAPASRQQAPRQEASQRSSSSPPKPQKNQPQKAQPKTANRDSARRDVDSRRTEKRVQRATEREEPARPAVPRTESKPTSEPVAKEASPLPTESLQAAPPQAAEEPKVPAGFGVGALALPDWFPFGGKKKRKPAEEVALPAEPPEATPQESPNSDELARTTPSEESPLVSSGEAGDGATGNGATGEQEATGEDRPPGKRRRRGRRRGGRGRSRRSSENAGESASEGEGEEAAVQATQGDGDARDARQVASFDSAQREEEAAEVVESAEAESDDGETKSISHKNITSWGDAIGVVVDANIAARGQRKQSYRGGGRGGSSRGGRSRGRRGGRSES